MKKPQKNGKSVRKYSRTTPIGRVLRNVIRAGENAEASLKRLRSWSYANDERIRAIEAMVLKAKEILDDVRARAIPPLVESRWAPPKKSLAVSFDPGEKVKISKRFLSKYSEVYDTEITSSLVVSKVLDTGEIAVRSGNRIPFIVAKTHLEARD